MYGVMLLLHLLAATIWTGGHLVLATCVLPSVLRERSAPELLRFESAYERIGMPALVIQIVTGLWLAHHWLPQPQNWLSFEAGPGRLIALKLSLLTLTAALALDARFRVIPKLSADNLVDMAWHIYGVTCLSVLFVVVGLSFRTGWLL
jgi:putative copper export protein